MSYTCPDCEDGILEPKFRKIALELTDGEKAEIVGDVVLVSSVGCNNGCSADNEEEEEKPKRKKNKKAPTVAGEPCEHDGCIRSAGHTGSHYRKVQA